MADLLTEAKFRAAQIALAQTQARLSTLWDAKQPLDVALSQFEATLTAAMAAKNKAADDLLALASGDASALPEVIEPSSIDSVLRTERFAGKPSFDDRPYPAIFFFAERPRSLKVQITAGAF